MDLLLLLGIGLTALVGTLVAIWVIPLAIVATLAATAIDDPA